MTEQETLNPVPFVLGKIKELYLRLERWTLDAKHASYGVSVARILYGLFAVLFVLTNFQYRNIMWGSGAQWTDPLRWNSTWGFPFVFYSTADSTLIFTLKYLLLGLAGLSLMVGFFSRTSAIVVLYLTISLVNLNPAATDAQDNIYRIMLLLFCFTDWSRHFSVDAWRRNRRALSQKPGGWAYLRDFVPAWIPNGIHNIALIAIAYQLFMVYVIAGVSKIAGDMWRSGTAIYFPLASDRFNVWPFLNQLLYSNGFMVGLVTFFSVGIQIAFPLMLLQRWTRIIGLLGISAMHIMIGVVMGLGLFSLAMIAADVIFIRNDTYQWMGRKLRAIGERLRIRYRTKQIKMGRLEADPVESAAAPAAKAASVKPGQPEKALHNSIKKR